MDRKKAAMFEECYEMINSFSIVGSEKDRRGLHGKSFTYGETPIPAMRRILAEVRPKKSDVFYDLGSGTGKAVFTAALYFPFRKAVGIECLKDCVRLCNEMKRLLELENVEFRHGSMGRIDWSDATVVYAHSTCFSDSLMRTILKKMKGLKRGARVILITKTPQADFLRLDKAIKIRLSWGEATVSFYTKV
jgi:ubiquinone/menaquinone biosynthesis C-methylase UbiE